MSENSVPNGALGLAVIVILYSAICLSLSSLLFFLLYRQHNELTYVALVALGTSLGSLASLIQQIHYSVDFRTIKLAQDAAGLTESAGAVVAGGSVGLDLVLFWIQFYSYNVNALLILFWSLQLFKNTWRLQSKSVWWTENAIEHSCKAFAILFPGFLFGIVQLRGIKTHWILFLLLVNVILGISLIGGSIFLALTLYKFVEARRNVNDSSQEFAQSGLSHGATATVTANLNPFNDNNQRLSYKRKNDRWLIIRFTIAFFVLSIFEIAVVMFQVVAYNRHQTATRTKMVDMSTSSALIEIVQFMPGVTASLVAFLTWGTTASFRKEIRELFICTSSRRNNHHTPTSRPPLYRNKLSSLSVRLYKKSHSDSESSDFKRLQDDQDAMPPLKDIQVTTELTVLTESIRVNESNAEAQLEMDVIGPWTMKEDFDYAVDVKPPVRSKSKMGLVRTGSKLSHFHLPPVA